MVAFLVFDGNDFGVSGKPDYGGIFSAVMQYGGHFLAVGGFSFSGGNDFGGSFKPKFSGIIFAIMQYGGICLAVMQYGGNAIRRSCNTAVMQYGGIFLAVRGCSFFGGNVNVS